MADADPGVRILSHAQWRARHRVILRILWAHIPALIAFGLWRGDAIPRILEVPTTIHVVGEVSVAGIFAAMAGWPVFQERTRGLMASLGLVTCSGLLVHLSGGYIEAHFHFFVVLGLISMYLDWVPYVVALAYVLVHHGVVGTLYPETVYNHPAAFAHPWRWAAIHAAFVLALSLSQLFHWKQAQQYASQHEDVLASAVDGIVGVSRKGKITYANAAAGQMVGRDARQLMGEPYGQAFPRTPDPAIPEGGWLHGRAGSLPVEVHARPSRGSNGGGQVVSIRDISDRLERDQLRLAEEAERAANRAKTTFLANMSHEIRTPLNAIIGMSEILADTQLDDEQKDHVRIVQASGEHLLTVISDILDLAKIEAGHFQLDEAPAALLPICENALDIVRPTADDKGLELLWEPHELPEAIQADAGRLRQILVNLLGNAVKFTDAGHVHLKASRSDGHLRFEVRDTGIGIPEGLDPFAPFRQGDPSSRRRHGGTGLGLAIAWHLVQLMGGTIGFERRDPGTTFWLDLPYSEARLGEPAAGLSRLDDVAVLIVDDSRINLEILEHHLRQWGADVTRFASPHEAAKACRERRFDIALLDYHMPGMDGAELAKEIRQTQETPLILLASGAWQRGDAALHGAQFAKVLRKPVKPHQLHAAMSDILAGRRPAAATPAFDHHMAESHPLRILLVEDNRVNRIVAQKLLGRFGYATDTARDGSEAVEHCLERRYDLVLMDIEMPGMDGYEATRKILARSALRIVGMTAHVSLEDRHRCLEVGMQDYVPKPIKVADLQRVLRETRPIAS